MTIKRENIPWEKRRLKTPWLNSKGELKPGYLENINPYLFLLLKRLILYEAKKYQDFLITKGLAINVKSQSQKDDDTKKIVCDYIHDTISEKFANNVVGRFIWNWQTFNFREIDLDILVTAIPTFGKFTKWSEFAELYGKNTYAEIAERFTHKGFSDLDISLQEAVKAMVAITYGIIISVLTDIADRSMENIDIDMDLILNFFKKAKKEKNQSYIFLANSILSFLDYARLTQESQGDGEEEEEEEEEYEELYEMPINQLFISIRYAHFSRHCDDDSIYTKIKLHSQRILQIIHNS